MVTMEPENSELVMERQQPVQQPQLPTSEEVTLETLTEEVNVGSGATNANGGQLVNHPLFAPTSPRSVTTASMSASGKPKFLIVSLEEISLELANFREHYLI